MKSLRWTPEVELHLEASTPVKLYQSLLLTEKINLLSSIANLSLLIDKSINY